MKNKLSKKSTGVEVNPRAWKLLTENPNAYFVVPEFGVIPSEAFGPGFKRPVCGLVHWDDWTDQIVEMIRIARLLAQRRFPTLEDITIAYLSAKQALEEDYGAELSSLHCDALIYFMILNSLERVCGFHGSDVIRPKQRLIELAVAGANLARWATGDRAALEMADIVDRMRRGAARGGQKGARTRQRKADENRAIVLEHAHRLGWPKHVLHINKLIAKKVDLSATRVGQILLAENKRLSGCET